MGTNWYIDDGTEGDDYERLPHIGKFIFKNNGRNFLFYRSKEFQVSKLIELMETNNEVFAVSEEGERRSLSVLLGEVIDLPYTEDAVEFF
jgi:hypothetical protein